MIRPTGTRRKMAPRGAIFLCRALTLVMMLDDHDLLVVLMPAMIAMHVVAMLDHHGFSAGNRRRRNRDGTNGGNNVSKLLHVVLHFM